MECIENGFDVTRIALLCHRPSIISVVRSACRLAVRLRRSVKTSSHGRSPELDLEPEATLLTYVHEVFFDEG